jgi:hypothetical protein
MFKFIRTHHFEKLAKLCAFALPIVLTVGCNSSKNQDATSDGQRKLDEVVKLQQENNKRGGTRDMLDKMAAPGDIKEGERNKSH